MGIMGFVVMFGDLLRSLSERNSVLQRTYSRSNKASHFLLVLFKSLADCGFSCFEKETALILKLTERFQQRYCHYSLNNSSKVVDLDQLAPASASASASALACRVSALKKCLEFHAVAEACGASLWLFAWDLELESAWLFAQPGATC